MWLILEDDLERMDAFQEVANMYSPPQELKVWRIASCMIEKLTVFLDHATVISLDHDLYRYWDGDPEPGTGRDVANYLATLAPVCPIIIHSANTNAAWGMYNELTHAKWRVKLIHHSDEPQWIQKRWVSLVRELTTDEISNLSSNTDALKCTD